MICRTARWVLDILQTDCRRARDFWLRRLDAVAKFHCARGELRIAAARAYSFASRSIELFENVRFETVSGV